MRNSGKGSTPASGAPIPVGVSAPRRASRRLTSLYHRPARRGADESGFSLIEVMVALMLLAIVLTSVAYSLTSSFTNVGFSSQQQAATGLANKALEEVRGLPYATLLAGLNTNEGTALSTDPNIDTSTTPWTFKGTGEQLVYSTWASGAADVPPFYPHTSTDTINNTVYSVSTYPTHYKGSHSEFRMTVIVTWTPSDRPGVAAKVSAQTVIYSPATGCLSANTHPYAAPCQPYFRSSATLGQGYIQIAPASGATGDAIYGIPLTNAELYLPRADSNIDTEQISNLLGGAYTSGGTISEQDLTPQSTGELPGTVQADSDPGSNMAPAAINSVTNTGSPYITASSGGANADSLTITPGGSDQGNAVATTVASTALDSAGSPPACQDLAYPTGNTQSSGQACADSNVTQSGDLTGVMDLYAGSSDLGDAPLATVETPSVNMTTGTFVERFTSSGSTYCSNASGDGCVHAAAQRQIGTVKVGGLPANVPAPAGWAGGNYLFKLSNYSDSVSAESGIGTNSPASTTSVPAPGESAPSFQYWNGSGYTSVPWPSSPTPITPAPVSISYNPPSGYTLTVTESATLTIGGGVSSTSSGTSPCSSACSLTASSASPVIGDVTYEVTWDNEVLADLDIHVDLGTIMATTTYQEAPSA